MTFEIYIVMVIPDGISLLLFLKNFMITISDYGRMTVFNIIY